MAGEGSVLSQQLLLLLDQTLVRGVKFWGCLKLLQPSLLAAPCERRELVLSLVQTSSI